jgi:hypothetical protein
MTEIIEAIDAWTQDRYSSLYDLKLHGFCELVRETSGEATQVYPMTIPDVNGDRVQVSIDDAFEFITWMRWSEPATYQPNESWSFGKKEARFATLPIRLVLAHKVELGEDLVFDFINAFPSRFSINGYQFVFASPSLGADPDHETIYTTELGNTVYELHRFPWNIYVININIEFMKCPDGSEADFITDEFGNCLTS